MAKKIKIIFIIIWIAAMAYTGYALFNYYLVSNQNAKMYGALQAEIAQAATAVETTEAETTALSTQKTTIDFSQLQEKSGNSEVIGWLTIPDTTINYPVVKAEDNDFYLTHDLYRNSNSAGSIFMDYRNSGGMDEMNTIIYGHYMRDGSMFADLHNYQSEEFLKEHSIITYDSQTEKTYWEIFSVYIVDPEFDYIQTVFADNQEYTDFITSIEDKSMFSSTEQVTVNDQILTLSTCTSGIANQRFVIHAKKISE